MLFVQAAVDQTITPQASVRTFAFNYLIICKPVTFFSEHPGGNSATHTDLCYSFSFGCPMSEWIWHLPLFCQLLPTQQFAFQHFTGFSLRLLVATKLGVVFHPTGQPANWFLSMFLCLIVHLK